MVFSQGRKETTLKKTEKKGCWKRLGRVASQQMLFCKVKTTTQNFSFPSVDPIPD